MVWYDPESFYFGFLQIWKWGRERICLTCLWSMMPFVSPFWPVLSTLVSVNVSWPYFLLTFSQSQALWYSSLCSFLIQIAFFLFLQVIPFSILSHNLSAPPSHLASFQATSLTHHFFLISFLPYGSSPSNCLSQTLPSPCQLCHLLLAYNNGILSWSPVYSLR